MGWEEILKMVSKNIETGQLTTLVLILIIAAPIYVLVNLSRVADSYDNFRKRKQAIIKEYFDKDVVRDLNTEQIMADMREAMYFKHVVGIYAEEKYRHALIKLHAEMSPAIEWRTIRKAIRYLRADNDHIKVRFTLSALISYMLYIPLYFLVSFIILLLGQQFILQPIAFLQQANKIMYVLVYSLLFSVLLSEIWTIHSAYRIWKLLNNGKRTTELIKEAWNAR